MDEDGLYKEKEADKLEDSFFNKLRDPNQADAQDNILAPKKKTGVAEEAKATEQFKKMNLA